MKHLPSAAPASRRDFLRTAALTGVGVWALTSPASAFAKVQGIPARTNGARHPAPRNNGPQHAVIDTLSSATPDDQFSIYGSQGVSILTTQNAGPQFVLSRPTMITEIGGFLNIGASLTNNPLPFLVDIRPSVNGLPDVNTVLGTFELSQDNDLQLISYESVSCRLHLRAGTYFALIKPGQAGDDGYILTGAQAPFPYAAGSAYFGFLDPTTRTATASGHAAAMRILAGGR